MEERNINITHGIGILSDIISQLCDQSPYGLVGQSVQQENENG